jgi:uncharacterized protein (TIGR01777 family)
MVITESLKSETRSRVIITGGTGFIGRPLSLRLIHEGFDVVCLTRNASAAKNRGRDRIKFVEWDGESAAGWSDYAEGAAAIINLAGESIGSGRWTEEKKRRILQSRMNAGKAVVEAIRSVNRKPEVLIQASAIGIYGNRGNEILDESSGPGERFLADVARKWEESTRDIEALGVRRVVIRSGIVLGSSGGALSRLLLPYRFFVGGPLGSKKQWMSWIHIEDEIGSILFLIRRQALHGVFNLTAPQPLQNKTFNRILGKILNRPSWLPVPSFLLKLFLGKMAEETILTSQRVLPTRLEETGFKFVFPELTEALADILGNL